MADLTLARKVLETEAAAILALVPRLDDRFHTAVGMLQHCRGRVILTGMGKSGIICRKIAATLNSTGTAALFLHPADAIHGDLGVIQATMSSSRCRIAAKRAKSFACSRPSAGLGQS